MKESREERARRFEERINEQFDDVEIIPSYADRGISLIPEKELVGAYCRVSTMQEAQVDSFIMQKKYYEDYVKQREGWDLIEIYADERIILGTSQEVLAPQGFPDLVLIFIWLEITGP